VGNLKRENPFRQKFRGFRNAHPKKKKVGNDQLREKKKRKRHGYPTHSPTSTWRICHKRDPFGIYALWRDTKK